MTDAKALADRLAYGDMNKSRHEERMLNGDERDLIVTALRALAANNQEAWVAALLNAPNPAATPAVGGQIRDQIARIILMMVDEDEEACLAAADRILALAQPASPLRGREIALEKALTNLCDEIGNKELHGDGAHDSNCSICRSHKRARKLLAAPPEQPAADPEIFKCNCPFEVRSGCSEPKCPHYVKPAATATGATLTEAWKRYPQTGGTHRQAFIEGATWAAADPVTGRNGK